MNIQEVAKLSGVSVRTLHHYDRIGLLVPARRCENGYRDYGDADLDRLQQILFFRACGFPLAEIGKMLDNPAFDRMAALRLQQKTLLHQKERIERMLETLQKTIETTKGDRTMSQKEKFEGFDFKDNPYEEEARTLWGDEAVDKSNAALGSLDEAGQQQLQTKMNTLFASLAAFRQGDPAAPDAQAAVGELYHFLNGNFGVHYSPEAFRGLGQMYVDDARFTKNIDCFGAGLAAFLRDAMAVYADGLQP